MTKEEKNILSKAANKLLAIEKQGFPNLKSRLDEITKTLLKISDSLPAGKLKDFFQQIKDLLGEAVKEKDQVQSLQILTSLECELDYFSKDVPEVIQNAYHNIIALAIMVTETIS